MVKEPQDLRLLYHVIMFFPPLTLLVHIGLLGVTSLIAYIVLAVPVNYTAVGCKNFPDINIILITRLLSI